MDTFFIGGAALSSAMVDGERTRIQWSERRRDLYSLDEVRRGPERGELMGCYKGVVDGRGGFHAFQ